jgi:hypothetical protein
MQFLGFNDGGAPASNAGQWQDQPGTEAPGSVPYAQAMPQPACLPYGMPAGADFCSPRSAPAKESDIAALGAPAPAIELIQQMSRIQHMSDAEVSPVD